MARTNLTRRQIQNPTFNTHREAIYDKLVDVDQALDAIGLPGAGGTVTQHLTANGAVSIVVPLTTLAVSGTMAFTLASGTYIGQTKTIRATSAASTPNGVVTGVFINAATNGTTLTFDAAEDAVDLIWNGTRWAIARLDGAAMA